MSVSRKTPYPVDAFLFVQQGLDYTVRRIHGPQRNDSKPGNRHVTGQQLCHGLREYAIEQYGLLARTTLRHWKITCSEDFGRIVFAMIDAGLMQRTDDDSLDDFANVFNFNEAFNCSLEIGQGKRM